MLTHPAVEVRLIDAMTLLDFLGAREFFVFPDAVRHDDAPSIFLDVGERHSRPPFNAQRLHTSEVQVWQWRGYAPRPDRPPGEACGYGHNPLPGRPHRRPRRRHRPGSRCR